MFFGPSMSSSRGVEAAAWTAMAVAAVAVRLGAFVERAELGTFTGLIDTGYYLERARDILEGGAIPSEAIFMSPLYPYVLAALGGAGVADGGNFLAAVLVQVFLGVAGLLGGAWLARRFAGRLAALSTLGLGAFAAPLAFYDSSLLPDGPTAALLAVGVAALATAPERPGRARLLGSGVALGLATLLRSNILLPALLVVGWYVWTRRASMWRAAAAGAWVALPVGAALVAVAAANLAAEGSWSPLSTNSGLNLFVGNNPVGRGTYTVVQGVHPGDPRGRSVAEAAWGRPLSSTEIDEYWRRRALEFVKERPTRFARVLVNKAWLFWSAYEIPQMENLELAKAESLALRLAPVGFGWILPLAVLGWAWLDVRARRRAVPLLLVLGAAWLTCVVFFVNGRIRLPAWPALLPLAGCGVAAIPTVLRSGLRGRWTPWLALALAAVAAAWVEKVPRRWNAAQSALRYAVMEAQAGHVGRAREWVRWEGSAVGDESLREDPGLALERGAALYAIGDYEAAFPHLRRAADAMPGNARAQQGLLAVCGRLLARGDGDASVRDAARRARGRLEAGR